MNPEQQRIAIAEACGWRKGDLRPSWCHPDNWSMAKNGSYEVWVSQDKLPDYLNDLNAMHDAEKVLWDTGKAMEFTNRLVGIVCLARGFRWDKGTEDDHLMCLSHATASQRAEAFLRTIGKWEEAK